MKRFLFVVVLYARGEIPARTIHREFEAATLEDAWKQLFHYFDKYKACYAVKRIYVEI
jgi:hypothetical protein